MATIGKVCIYVLFGSCMAMYLWMLIRKQLWSEEETFTSNEGTEYWRKAKEAHWGKPEWARTSKNFIGSSFCKYKRQNKHQTLQVLVRHERVLCSIWNLPHIFSLSLYYTIPLYMIVGLSVSWKYWQGFPEQPYMVVGPSVSRKHVTKF